VVFARVEVNLPAHSLSRWLGIIKSASDSESMMFQLKSRLKEALLVLAITFGLFSVVFGLVIVLQPEPAVDTITELVTTNAPSSNATPLTGELAKQGASLFGRNCAHCHGDDARGDEGPDLHDLTKTDARITKIIKEGIKGEMPRFGSKFTDADVQALIAFIRTLKN
jgi:cytochrome c2